MRTSYYESQVSLAKNYYIFQLSCTIDENNFFFFYENGLKKKLFLGKKQPPNQW